MKKIALLAALLTTSAFAYPVNHYKCNDNTEISVMHAEHDVNLAWVSTQGLSVQLSTGEFEMDYAQNGAYTFTILVQTNLPTNEFNCVEFKVPNTPPAPHRPHQPQYPEYY